MSGLGGIVLTDRVAALSYPSAYEMSGGVYAGNDLDDMFGLTSELLTFYTEDTDTTPEEAQHMYKNRKDCSRKSCTTEERENWQKWRKYQDIVTQNID